MAVGKPDDLAPRPSHPTEITALQRSPTMTDTFSNMPQIKALSDDFIDRVDAVSVDLLAHLKNLHGDAECSVVIFAVANALAHVIVDTTKAGLEIQTTEKMSALLRPMVQGAMADRRLIIN